MHGALRVLGDAQVLTPAGSPGRLYPEKFAVLGEADLLQPRLDLGLLPAGHAGQDGPRHLLTQQAQGALGQRRRGAIGGVGNQAFQALDGTNVAEYLGRGEESVFCIHQLFSQPPANAPRPSPVTSLFSLLKVGPSALAPPPSDKSRSPLDCPS